MAVPCLRFLPVLVGAAAAAGAAVGMAAVVPHAGTASLTCGTWVSLTPHWAGVPTVTPELHLTTQLVAEDALLVTCCAAWPLASCFQHSAAYYMAHDAQFSAMLQCAHGGAARGHQHILAADSKAPGARRAPRLQTGQAGLCTQQVPHEIVAVTATLCGLAVLWTSGRGAPVKTWSMHACCKAFLLRIACCLSRCS
jgi:hypothetical protein